MNEEAQGAMGRQGGLGGEWVGAKDGGLGKVHEMVDHPDGAESGGLTDPGLVYDGTRDSFGSLFCFFAFFWPCSLNFALISRKTPTTIPWPSVSSSRTQTSLGLG